MSRLSNARSELERFEQTKPADYQSKYKGQIDNVMGKLDDLGGYDYDPAADTAYQQYKSEYTQKAKLANQNAQANASALTGGYGSSYGTQAGQKAYAATMSDLDNLLTQDQLARSEYDGNVADAANLRNYRYGRTQQARQENSDFWGNVWNVVKNVGAAALEGYDAYKGYRQQDWENAFALRQYNDNLSRTELSDQMAALQQAASYKEAGFDDAAKQILNQYGLTDTMLDSWQGLSQVDKDKLDYLTTAAGLAGSGYDTAANNYLQMAGLPTGSVDSYSTIANRLNQADLAKYASQLAISNRYKTTTGTGSGRGGKNSNQNTNKQRNKTDGYTQPQLNTMFKEYSTMKPDDQRRSYYEDTLADAGRIQRLTGTGNPGKANGTAWEQGMYNARKMANSGYSQNQIASELANNTSLSSYQISAIMNQIDYEWRGTK